MAGNDNLDRWAREYAARLSERGRELDRYIELSLTMRAPATGVHTPRWLEAGVARRAEHRIPARNLLKINAPKQSLLLGPPGCGKTATTKFLSKWLLERFLSGEDNRLPFLLEGREINAEHGSLWDSIHASFIHLTPGRDFDMVKRAARDGSMVLLLDGLDESAPSLLGGTVRSVEDWALRHPSSSCIVTSRVADAPSLNGFQEYEFAALSQEEVHLYVLMRLPEPAAQKFLAALNRRGAESVPMYSPVLLSLFIEEFQRRGALSDSASFTFADLVNRLFSRRIEPARRIAVTALLAHLARHLVNEGLNVAPRQVVFEMIQVNPDLFSSWRNDFDGVLSALIRTDCVVEQPGGGLAFVHRALLEHFAKSYLGQIDQVWTPTFAIPQKTIEVVRFVDQELVRRLAKHPTDLYRLSPRDFEKLVAELFRDRGWSVELTKQTRDGGSDIIAVRADMGLQFKLLIEAKRYRPDRPVGVGIVRELYAVRQLHHASKAVLATTSCFSEDAYREFASVMPWELELSDYQQILEWLKAYGRK